ncbi:flagellar protein FliT [Pseudomonas saudiphocaensis]|uniref:Flagellar protein FliT n=1 Tax=Pseudomonas saudiphocaensis TaxID=1499686 RepID=A0A078LU51_9PSED|nr:flagellar protein FliT [Pseudomonas saudiphocaensis]CDZ93852.1 signal transduction histidine kinase [Pseudomonas saudiphocaensis]
MQPILQSLEALQGDLREALAQQDWEAIGALDLRCRELVGEVGKSGDSALREPVEALSQLYAELQLTARQERERIASELTRLNQSKQVSRAYESLG